MVNITKNESIQPISWKSSPSIDRLPTVYCGAGAPAGHQSSTKIGKITWQHLKQWRNIIKMTIYDGSLITQCVRDAASPLGAPSRITQSLTRSATKVIVTVNSQMYFSLIQPPRNGKINSTENGSTLPHHAELSYDRPIEPERKPSSAMSPR